MVTPEVADNLRLAVLEDFNAENLEEVRGMHLRLLVNGQICIFESFTFEKIGSNLVRIRSNRRLGNYIEKSYVDFPENTGDIKIVEA